MRNSIIFSDALTALKTLPDELVRVCVTSPPYWGGQRDYDGHRQWFDEPETPCDHDKDIEHGPHHPGQVEETKWKTAEGAGKGQTATTSSCSKCGAWYGQLGQEPEVEGYVTHLVEILRETRRVLSDDGSLWLNIGDVYKDKQLVGVPWRVALALQADGWILRSSVQWCLSGGAWVYARMQKGDMPIMVKDLMRRDPATVQLWNGASWTKVLGWGKSTDTKERLELVLRSGERIGCTGQHLWPTSRGLVTANELVLGDVLKTCMLPEPENVSLPGYLTEDVLWFVGLYLAEGSRAQDVIQVSLHADEAKWLIRLESVAKHLGGTLTHTLDNNSLHVRMYGGIIGATLAQHIGGKTAHDKHLKVPCWEYPNQALRCIMAGYLDGDGHFEKNNNRWRLGFCRNYHWERDLRVLAARLGATLTLHPRTSKYQGGVRPTFQGEWRWERSGHHCEQDRGEVIEVRRSRAREFWDISVADEPHTFSLASGVLTHNCKPNAKPESVKDRPTRAHEPIFLLTKSDDYYYDHSAVMEEAVDGGLRSMRDVWNIPYEPLARVKYKREANFAVFPTEIPRRCILASSRPGDLVLDIFTGSGTTLGVAKRLRRDYLGIEANASYAELIERRIDALGGSVPMEDAIEGLVE